MSGVREPAIPDQDADRALKAKHRALWGSGDYAAVAAELIPGARARAGQSLPGYGPGGQGSGRRGRFRQCGHSGGGKPARIVTASDLTPELFDAGRRLAAQRGVELEWVEADAEALPFADNGFDVVMSCVGVMFAPHHQAAADELIRVARPGGTIALINWTPEGFIGNLFKTMKPYAPPPPPGASPAPLWGDRGSRARAVRRPGRRPRLCAGRRSCSTTARNRPSFWRTGSETTGRRSPPTSSTPTHPNGSTPSTAPSSTSLSLRTGATGGVPTGRPNTCWSPPPSVRTRPSGREGHCAVHLYT